MEIEFIWDAEKEELNVTKHGVSFESAQQVFFDPYLLVVEDREMDDEMRYHAIGHTAAGPLLLTVFVDRSDDKKEIIRIISAREAEKYEQRAYARQFEERH